MSAKGAAKKKDTHSPQDPPRKTIIVQEDEQGQINVSTAGFVDADQSIGWARKTCNPEFLEQAIRMAEMRAQQPPS